MVDPDPNKTKKKIAQLIRMLGTTGGERRNTWHALERAMQSIGVSWSDLGNWIEQGAECADGKFTEAELQEFGQAMRAEGVEAGIKIGQARAGGSGGNGHLTLPKPFAMADYCKQRPHQLKDDNQREFVAKMFSITRRGANLSPARLGYLASIYIQIGGKV